MITSIGGTLGLTSAYGVSDPTITRRRVEADLAVFREYQMKYRGMLEACKQQLGWGEERYAKFPDPPELLKLEEVPSFWKGLGIGLLLAPLWVPLMIYYTLLLIRSGIMGSPEFWAKHVNFFFFLAILGGCVMCVLFCLFNHFRVKVANGNKPWENARRQKAYEEAVAAALKAAEPLKAAEDHRLRCQIRESEGLAKTFAEKEQDVRRILATL